MKAEEELIQLIKNTEKFRIHEKQFNMFDKINYQTFHKSRKAHRKRIQNQRNLIKNRENKKFIIRLKRNEHGQYEIEKSELNIQKKNVQSKNPYIKLKYIHKPRYSLKSNLTNSNSEERNEKSETDGQREKIKFLKINSLGCKCKNFSDTTEDMICMRCYILYSKFFNLP